MKNVILGMIGGFVILLSIIVCLSFYGTQSRKNEMENNLSEIVENVLRENYVPEKFLTGTESYPSAQSVEASIEEELKLRISSKTDLAVHVKACDFEKGILSVTVEESFVSATGKTKTLQFERTALVAD